ncbi:MAG: hypothetical protein DMG65_06595 [Candidatus Angelobacter sp. Gp1-AA117]|nr:MAG: hypothetical protein DMG65_06595 [Candidatus Angelobacter sp. Gp1-AA117]
MYTTMREAVLAHSGEALQSRLAFQEMTPHEQDCVIEFLKSLQILPPSVKDLIVNEDGRKRSGTQTSSTSSSEIFSAIWCSCATAFFRFGPGRCTRRRWRNHVTRTIHQCVCGQSKRRHRSCDSRESLNPELEIVDDEAPADLAY